MICTSPYKASTHLVVGKAEVGVIVSGNESADCDNTIGELTTTPPVLNDNGDCVVRVVSGVAGVSVGGNVGVLN